MSLVTRTVLTFDARSRANASMASAFEKSPKGNKPVFNPASLLDAAVSLARFTAADSTPGTFAGIFSTRATQEAQVIPSMAKHQSLKHSDALMIMGTTVSDRAWRDLASEQTVSRLPRW